MEVPVGCAFGGHPLLASNFFLVLLYLSFSNVFPPNPCGSCIAHHVLIRKPLAAHFTVLLSCFLCPHRQMRNAVPLTLWRTSDVLPEEIFVLDIREACTCTSHVFHFLTWLKSLRSHGFSFA